MKPCVSQAVVMASAFQDDLNAFARAGFPAMEIWLTKLEQALESSTIERIQEKIAQSGVQPVAAAGQSGLLLSQGEERRLHWEQFRRRLGWLRVLGTETLILAADPGAGFVAERFGEVLTALREAADLAAEFGVRLALEFQARSRFCASLDTAAALVAQAGRANLGICLDAFHYYVGPSKFEDLALLSRNNLAWIQLCDLAGAPRELAGDPDRILPGDGDFQLAAILEQCHQIGYDGYVSLETLNPLFWRIAPERVADVGFQALARVLEQADQRRSGA